MHQTSNRAKGSFVPVNCAAIAAELIESELFGHVKGALHRGQQSREGLFSLHLAAALLLDEIVKCRLPRRPNCCECLRNGAFGRSVRSRKFRSMCGLLQRVTPMKTEVAAGRFRQGDLLPSAGCRG
ncbi:MAG: sigma 54-interacting transcriptional regulator [Betaproteobacteria bacterium]|nr:sigma 54-interacting transcriptional regulator [Betaproteobacteria bacterium]